MNVCDCSGQPAFAEQEDIEICIGHLITIREALVQIDVDYLYLRSRLEQLQAREAAIQLRIQQMQRYYQEMRNNCLSTHMHELEFYHQQVVDAVAQAKSELSRFHTEALATAQNLITSIEITIDEGAQEAVPAQVLQAFWDTRSLATHLWRQLESARGGAPDHFRTSLQFAHTASPL